VIHSYRHRYANAAGDPELESFEARLADKPKISAPAIVLQGENDQVNPPSTSEGHAEQFAGQYERRLLPNVGHCPPAEAPHKVAQAIEDVFGFAA
jgi:pimeloyl-ACP methyl ester carboxylesterase